MDSRVGKKSMISLGNSERCGGCITNGPSLATGGPREMLAGGTTELYSLILTFTLYLIPNDLTRCPCTCNRQ